MKKAVVFFMLLFVSLFCGCNLFLDTHTKENVDMTPRQISVSENLNTVELIEQVKSAVVGIECETSGGYAIGSGVAIKNDGYILTNQHVINGARNVRVYFADKSNADAKIIWQDSAQDLAVIKSSVNMPYLTCSTQNSMVGEDVLAIGTPLALDFQHTVTKGIVSANNRTIEIQNTNGTFGYMQNLIQHDASINPGNSGGPLINNKGEVIGINTFKASDAEGMGFAIPISVGKYVIDNLSINNNWTAGYMGILGLDIDVARIKGEQVSAKTGVFVAEIDENTICKDYFKKGDVIISLNEESINTLLDLRLQLYQYSSGDILNVKVLRDGEIVDVRYNMLKR